MFKAVMVKTRTLKGKWNYKYRNVQYAPCITFADYVRKKSTFLRNVEKIVSAENFFFFNADLNHRSYSHKIVTV